MTPHQCDRCKCCADYTETPRVRLGGGVHAVLCCACSNKWELLARSSPEGLQLEAILLQRASPPMGGLSWNNAVALVERQFAAENDMHLMATAWLLEAEETQDDSEPTQEEGRDAGEKEEPGGGAPIASGGW